MRVGTVTAFLIIIAIYFIMAVAAEVFIDDFLRPNSLFVYLLIGTVLTTLMAEVVNIDVPS